MEILNIIDDHSRLCVGSDALSVQGAPTWWRASTSPLRRTGSRPRCSRTTARCSPRRPEEAAAARSRWSRLAGDRAASLLPYHPQTCGKVERFHQTLKSWLAKHPNAKDVEVLQAPARSRSAPTTTRVGLTGRSAAHAGRGVRGESEGDTVASGFGSPGALPGARDRRGRGGGVTLRHDSRLHHIKVGRRHAGDAGAHARGRLRRSDRERGRRAASGARARSDPETTSGGPERGTMSRDTCERCPETSQWCRRGDLNPHGP